MKDFETWFNELVSDYKWAEPAQMHHRPETFKAAAHRVYMDCVAKGFKPIQECRSHVYNIIVKTPGDNKKVDWVSKALAKTEVKEEWEPADPEHVDKCVREFHQMLLNSPMMKRAPRLTEEEKIHFGDWLPATIQPKSEIEKQMVVKEHIRKVKAARSKLYLEHFPDATQEEVEAYVNKFSDL